MMLPSINKTVILITITLSIFVCVGIWLYPVQKVDTVCPSQNMSDAVYACVRPVHFDDLDQLQLLLTNNTQSHILAAEDIQAYNWWLYKQTQFGWRSSYPNPLNRFTRQIKDADQMISPGETLQLEGLTIYDLFDSSIANRTFAMLGQQDAEFSLDGGTFMIEISYKRPRQSTKFDNTIFTNSFTFKESADQDKEIRVHIIPQIANERDLVFLIVNEADSDIWLRPVGLTIYGDGTERSPEWPDIALMQRIDATAWNYIYPPITLANIVIEPIQIPSRTTYLWRPDDISGNLIIENEGVYRWRMPIWGEYYPDGHPDRADVTNHSEPFLNREYIIFTEAITVSKS